MIDEPYADYGTLLPQDSCAIVASRDGEVTFCLPKMDDDDETPELWAAMTMAMLKFSSDPEWVQDLVDEFIDKRRTN